MGNGFRRLQEAPKRLYKDPNSSHACEPESLPRSRPDLNKDALKEPKKAEGPTRMTPDVMAFGRNAGSVTQEPFS